MEVRLRPGTTINEAIEVLTKQNVDASNIASSPAPLLAYLGWAEATYRMLGHILSPAQVTELVETERYWRLHQATDAGHIDTRWIRELINREVQSRTDLLTKIISDLRATHGHWQDRGGLIVVPDTNVLIHHPNTVDYISWAAETAALGDVHVVIPLVVIDELDRLKRTGRTPQSKTRARVTLRTLNDLLNEHGEVIPLGQTGNNGLTTLEVLLDPPGHRRLPDADSEILDRASYLDEISNRSVKVHVATSDMGMLLRAKTQRLRANLLPDAAGQD